MGITMNITFITTTIDTTSHSRSMVIVRIANRHLGISRNSGRCTQSTAKDIVCNSAIMNVYYRIIDAAFCRCIGCLVTTAIDAMTNCTAININSYCLLRSTQNIVTAKDVVNNGVGTATFFHCYGNRTINVSSVITGSSFVVFTQTTTVDISFTTRSISIFNGTTIEIYLRIAICCCFLVWIWFICISCRTVCSVYLTLSTTTIYVTSDNSITNRSS